MNKEELIKKVEESIKEEAGQELIEFIKNRIQAQKELHQMLEHDTSDEKFKTTWHEKALEFECLQDVIHNMEERGTISVDSVISLIIQWI